MTFDVTDIEKWTPAQLEARADQTEAIAAKWQHAGNPGYADMLRMEVAALRYAAFQLGLDDFQKQREYTTMVGDDSFISRETKNHVEYVRADALDRLAATPSTGDEVVAWRWRNSETEDWRITKIEPLTDWKFIERLYARPQPADPTPTTYTEICSNEKCPRGGMPVEIVFPVADPTPASGDDFFNMLWEWFEGRCGKEYMRACQQDGGLSADDFKQMLDEHEQHLSSPQQPADGVRAALAPFASGADAFIPSLSDSHELQVCLPSRYSTPLFTIKVGEVRAAKKALEARQTMTRPIFAYAPQAQAIRDTLPGFGLSLEGNRLTAVTDRQHMQGIEDATFIEIENHPARVPNEIRQMLLINGFLHVVLSDEFKRAKVMRRNQIADELAKKAGS